LDFLKRANIDNAIHDSVETLAAVVEVCSAP
jgi:hypothetical protein